MIRNEFNKINTRGDAEVDLILEGPFGVLPVEIKYGVKASSAKLRQLDKFVKDNKLEFGLLINQSREACWLTKHVFQLPVTYL